MMSQMEKALNHVEIVIFSRNQDQEKLKQMLDELEDGHLQAGSATYASLLDWCGNSKALEEGKRIHRHIVEHGKNGDRFLQNLLVNMYGKSGAVDDARSVFETISNPNVFSWSIMITAYAQNGHYNSALHFFKKMSLEGIRPNKVTFLSVVDACAKSRDLAMGKEFHGRIIDSGSMAYDVVVGNAIVNFYGKCCKLDEAKSVFDEMLVRDLISWTAMISAFVQNGYPEEALKCFREMELEGIKPSKVTFMGVLDACTLLRKLVLCKGIHRRIIDAGFEGDESFGNSLVKMYGKCGSMDEMKCIFDKLKQKNVVSWTGMISAYAQNGCGNEALEQLHRMDLEGMEANEITFVSILDACATAAALAQGDNITERILESGFESHVVVATALVNMFGKFGSIEEARGVFNWMHETDVVSWNAMISVYTQNEHAVEALKLFQGMDLEGFQPDKVTFVSILDACASLPDLTRGKAIHECVVDCGLDSVAAVANGLVNMYGKCGRLDAARRIFDRLSYSRDVISWNVMISIHVQGGDGGEALKLFRKMDLEAVKPDVITFVSVVDAAASLGDLVQGKLIHARIVDACYESNVAVGNSLVNMYGKCQSLENARSMFSGMQQKDANSWCTFVAGYAQNGHANEAVQLFQEMQLEGVKPDRLTFVSILQAYAELKAARQTTIIHAQILDAGFESDVVVGNSLVSVYGKLGRLDDSRSLFDKMPQKSVVSWNAMIVAYGQNGHSKEALEVFKDMYSEGISPSGITFISVLFACSHAGLVEQGRDCFVLMVEEQDRVPSAEHYGCMIDLFGRAGRLDKAEELINSMPFLPDVVAWNTLLAASKCYGDVERGKRAAKQIVELDCKENSPYLALPTMFASAGNED